MPHRIVIDPADYAGTYGLFIIPVGAVREGIRGADGPQAFDLDANRYYVSLAHGTNFVFRLDASGDLISESAGLVCAAGRVTFATIHTHIIIPGSYKGTYAIAGVHDEPVSRPQYFVVLKDVVSTERDGGYALYFAPGNALRFNVSTAGDVSLNRHNINSGKGGHASLHLDVCTIRVRPINYSGEWLVRGAERAAAPGDRRITLIPHVSGYILETRPSINTRFDISEDGSPPAQVEFVDGKNTWTFELSKA